VSGECNKCLLHLWSAERNAVRRILDAELRNGNIRLVVQRRGQTRPSKLEICEGPDHRTPTARRAARAVYQLHLRRALERHLPGFTIAKLSNAMDLERSFGPIYARGVVARAAPPSPCSASTSRRPSPPSMPPFGILWLDACRHSADPRTPFEGLKRFLPAGTSALTRERLAHLDPGAAKWHLYEFDERHDALVQLDFADRGNVDTRLDPMKRQPSIASPTPFTR